MTSPDPRLPTRSSVPPFTLGAVTWTCWVEDGGRYVWRCPEGRLAVARTGRDWRAAVAGRDVGHAYVSPKAAMLAAMAADQQRRVA